MYDQIYQIIILLDILNCSQPDRKEALVGRDMFSDIKAE